MTKPTQAVAVVKPSAINLMASRMSVEPAKLFSTLKNTCFKNATDDELLALVVVANQYGLNPFLKELYAFPAKGGGIVPIVSVDGWNRMLVSEPNFDGIEFEFVEDNDGVPVSCTAIIYVKSRSHPVKITEYFDECKRDTQPWRDMPHRMLRNRTLCQASRIAFGFSGVKHEEEAEAIAVESVVTSASPAKPQEQITAPAATVTPQKEFETLVMTNGFTFSHVQKWGLETDNIPGADSMADFSEIPSEICKRLLRAPAGLLKGLEAVKSAAK